MYVSLDMDADTSICVDHTRVIIERQKNTVEGKTHYYVGIFAITTLTNFQDGIVPPELTDWNKSSGRQLIYSKKFNTVEEANIFYSETVGKMNKTLRVFQAVDVAGLSDLTKSIEKLNEQMADQVTSSEAVEEILNKQIVLFQELIAVLTPKPKPPAKSRSKKKEVVDAS